MSSPLSTLGDAVAAALNAGTWPLPFTAARKAQPLLDLEVLTGLAVLVVPGDRHVTTDDSDHQRLDVTVNLQQRLSVDPDQNVDAFEALSDLTSAIADALRNAYAPGTAWWCRETTDGYDKNELYLYGEYWGYIDCVFELITDFA